MIIRRLGLCAYRPQFEAMRAFTAGRTAATVDELWLLEHEPVYTLGLAGKAEHLLCNPQQIPLERIDRGGQITYHGPGQLVIYLLLDLARRGLKVRELVSIMEQALINALERYGIRGERLEGAPGVYVDGAKIAALGLRVSKGCSYHGLALNVEVGLEPFEWINPCGYAGLRTTRMRDFGVTDRLDVIGEQLLAQLQLLLPPTKPTAASAG